MESTNSVITINQDRIGKLPVPLIHHILSFLDIDLAVQTCVLSKRWRYIWNSLPTLNFDSCKFERNNSSRNTSFEDFVDMVFIRHESSDLQRFHLKWHSRGKTTRHVNKWILDAVRRNVQDLSVHINTDMSFELPHCLFNCQSLTKLELETGYRGKGIIFPQPIDLPRLKSLKFSGTSINDVNIFNKLTSSCPVLESLILRCSDIDTGDILNISFDIVKLKHFELSNCRYLCSSHYNRLNCIRLCAPYLTSLVWKDCLSRDYSLENLSSLVTADIEMNVPEDEGYEEPEDDGWTETYKDQHPVEDKEVYANRMMKFLRALDNVKSLKLSSGEVLEVVSIAPEILDSQPPQFCNLQHLDLEALHSRGCFRAITYLLKMSPNIESLTITTPSDEFNHHGNNEDDWEADLSLPSMLYHLKFLQVKGLNGCHNELKFLEILLENTMVLEELGFYSTESSYNSSAREKKLMQFNKKLKTFPRASSIRTIYVIKTDW